MPLFTHTSAPSETWYCFFVDSRGYYLKDNGDGTGTWEAFTLANVGDYLFSMAATESGSPIYEATNTSLGITYASSYAVTGFAIDETPLTASNIGNAIPTEAGAIASTELDADTPVEATITSFSADALAQIWTYAGRTLTSFPPSFTLTSPQPGVGLFIPGARLEQSPVSYKGSTIAGTTIVLLARVVAADGDWIQQADVSAAAATVLNLQDATDTTTASETVSGIVYDELQADGRWTEDGIGYNVAVSINGTRLAQAGTTYRVSLTLTTADGPIVMAWEVQT